MNALFAVGGHAEIIWWAYAASGAVLAGVTVGTVLAYRRARARLEAVTKVRS